MCGENVTQKENATLPPGSPQHVRGKLLIPVSCARFVRITPACAGKTSVSWIRKITRRDHPRMCGENARVVSPVMASVGSPPHVRGKPWNGYLGGTEAGITPACAGKTEQ